MPHFCPTFTWAEFGVISRAFWGQQPVHVETGTRILPPPLPTPLPSSISYITPTSPHFLVTSQPWRKILLSLSLPPCPRSPGIARSLEAMTSVLLAAAAAAAAAAVVKTKNCGDINGMDQTAKKEEEGVAARTTTAVKRRERTRGGGVDMTSNP
jgi:hypothetical protein